MQVSIASEWLTRPSSYAWRVHSYYLCETLTGAVIYFMAVFAPWAFGTTQGWSIWIMNTCGYALGAMLLFKIWVRASVPALGPNIHLSLNAGALLFCTVATLTYCLVSALNFRAAYHALSMTFSYRPALGWLPSSLDGPSSWRAFASYAGLACSFWAIWDWLRLQYELRARAFFGKTSADSGTPLLPPRLRSLLWVITASSGLLAAEGVVQRLCNVPCLLFAVKPKIHQLAIEQFASYAYRANAAQYFNLVWPVCLGFWSSLTGKSRHRPIRGGLLFAVVLMAACPLIAGSRGPAIVSLAMLGLGLPLLMQVKPAWQLHKQRFVEINNQRARVRSFQIGLFFASVLLLGLGLGWHTLRPRLDRMTFDLAQRERLYDIGRRIAHDYSLFGTGPATFESVSQLYRNSPDDYWPAQLHNDWLETKVTFGWIGSALILSALAIVLAKSFSLNSQLPQRRFLCWVWLALGGCLFEARWDFPLQIYSILFLFLTWCAASLAVVGMPHALDKATSNT